MRVFAIGDLHLSGAVNKPMDIFGAAWDHHADRIAAAWNDLVSSEDLVLLPGDFSWAMHLEDVLPDFEFLRGLPGKKALIRGNHDYWWSSVTKVRRLLPEGTYALQNECIDIGGLEIVGTRGWVCPGSVGFDPKVDQKIYDREVNRLKLSLLGLTGKPSVAMLHYPPFNEGREESGFTKLLEEAGVPLVVYGHLHGRSCRIAFEGKRNGVDYRLVSADHVGFAPKFLFEI